MILYERALAEKKRLETQISSTRKLLENFPKENFFCTQNGKYTKWYATDGKKQTYIPKRNRALASKLASKKYYSLLLEDLIHEKRAIEFYLRHHNSKGSQAEKLLFKTPEYRKLMSSCFLPLSDTLQEWMNSPFESNPQFPDKLIHKALSGRYVRSKSETMIDMCLYKQKLPFRYEAALPLGEITLYPDFTIRHPETGKLFYWEHFGMIDDANYCQNMISKLKLYTSYGIFPSIQLITTYETKDHPLNIELVENLVEYYFL